MRRRHYAKNREHELAGNREYAATHREQRRQRDRRRYAQSEAERQRVADASRARYARKRVEIIARVRKWRRGKPPEWHAARQQRQREWRRENPEKVAAANARRRAGTAFTTAEWCALRYFFGCCVACGTTERPLEPDHVVPLSLGGAPTIENIQPLCGPCNRRKGATIADYRG